MDESTYVNYMLFLGILHVEDAVHALTPVGVDAVHAVALFLVVI